ncbi:hypothetical protein, partial [Gilvibacter sp.]|uniref:hypothetical protein n=1 Tax=Gilvibacter sp. TaxID=2729997 RepID=UPI0035BE8C78
IERSKIFTPDKEKKNSDYADEQFMIRVGDDVVLSDEGIATLKKLYTLNLVTKDQLEAAGVVLDEFNTDGILEKEDFGDSDIDILIRKIDSSKAAKGIRFRCQPVNSIFTK